MGECSCGPEEMMSPLLQERAEGGAAEGEPAPRLQLPRERSRAHVRGGVGINRSRNGRDWLRSELPGRGLELPGRVHAREAEGWCYSCCARRTAYTPSRPPRPSVTAHGSLGRAHPLCPKGLPPLGREGESLGGRGEKGPFCLSGWRRGRAVPCSSPS